MTASSATKVQNSYFYDPCQVNVALYRSLPESIPTLNHRALDDRGTERPSLTTLLENEG